MAKNIYSISRHQFMKGDDNTVLFFLPKKVAGMTEIAVF
jgi:hypothetical protein